MVLQYFGFRDQPFGVTPDPAFLYLSATHREALASLYYGLQTGRGFFALVAQPGMGKTTLLTHVLRNLSNTRTAFVFQTQCNRLEFLRFVLHELGLDASGNDVVRMHDQFNHFLAQEARANRQVVVAVDEAHNLTPEVLEAIRLLSDFETPRAKLLQIVLAGQPALAEKLAWPALAQLRQRLSVVCHLKPFDRAEVEGYVERRLQVAGYTRGRLFTPEAMAAIARHSGGIPRNINNLCFHALSIVCADSRREVDAEVMAEAIADLDIGKLAQPAAPPAEADALPAAQPEAVVETVAPARPQVSPVTKPVVVRPASPVVPIRMEGRPAVSRMPAPAWRPAPPAVVPASESKARASVQHAFEGSAALQARLPAPSPSFASARPVAMPVRRPAVPAGVYPSRAKSYELKTGAPTRALVAAAVIALLLLGVALFYWRLVPEAAEAGAANHSAAEQSQVTASFSKGTPLVRPLPEYPSSARRAGVQGEVALDCVVGRDGRVQQANVVRGDALLADAALSAVRQWRFAPAYANRRSGPVQTTVTFRFSLLQ